MTISPQRSRVAYYATIASLSALLGLLAFAIGQRDLLYSLDLSAYDLLVAFQHREPPSDQIVNVDFDESTVRHYNAFPIPRLLLADVITKVSGTKPSVIGVDIILDIKRNPDDDAHLA